MLVLTIESRLPPAPAGPTATMGIGAEVDDEKLGRAGEYCAVDAEVRLSLLLDEGVGAAAADADADAAPGGGVSLVRRGMLGTARPSRLRGR